MVFHTLLPVCELQVMEYARYGKQGVYIGKGGINISKY